MLHLGMAILKKFWVTKSSESAKSSTEQPLMSTKMVQLELQPLPLKLFHSKLHLMFPKRSQLTNLSYFSSGICHNMLFYLLENLPIPMLNEYKDDFLIDVFLLQIKLRLSGKNYGFWLILCSGYLCREKIELALWSFDCFRESNIRISIDWVAIL